MLGKGLESLIPPKGNKSGQSQPSFSATPIPTPLPVAPSVAASNGAGPIVPTNGLRDEGRLPASEDRAEIAAIESTDSAPASPVKNALVTGDGVPGVKTDITDSISRGEVVSKDKSIAIFHIEIEKVKSNPYQPRSHFEEESLRELASSIREFGVLQPIIVSKVVKESETGSDVEYELIAGERRLMASKLVGLRTIPAIIRRITPEREKLEIAIIENIQRKNLDPIEEARAYTRLQDEFRLTQREIAAKLGKSRETIANAVRLLNLPTDVQGAISAGKLSESQGRLLLTIDGIAEQQEMFNDILRGNLSVREIRARINRKRDWPDGIMSKVSPEGEALQERLQEFLGTKVELKEEGEKGKILINFYSKEELRAILEKLFKDK